MAAKPNLALLLGREPGESDELDDDEGDDTEEESGDDDSKQTEVITLLDKAFSKSLSAAERYDAFHEAVSLCSEDY